MGITVKLDTIILFINDVEHLKLFYRDVFNMEVIEEDGADWALLKAGSANIGLHRVGEDYINRYTGSGAQSNTKIVFETAEDLRLVREQLLDKGVAMLGLQRFPGYKYLLCDGHDPEGNMFQIKQKI